MSETFQGHVKLDELCTKSLKEERTVLDSIADSLSLFFMPIETVKGTRYKKMSECNNFIGTLARVSKAFAI